VKSGRLNRKERDLKIVQLDLFTLKRKGVFQKLGKSP
jgi:hypothetical protein